MRTIKLSELGAQPKYQAFVQRFLQAATVSPDHDVLIDVVDENGSLLAYYDASGDLRLTSPKVLLREVSDYVCSFEEAEEFSEAGFSAIHNALIDVHVRQFATCEFDDATTIICRFKD